MFTYLLVNQSEYISLYPSQFSQIRQITKDYNSMKKMQQNNETTYWLLYLFDILCACLANASTSSQKESLENMFAFLVNATSSKLLSYRFITPLSWESRTNPIFGDKYQTVQRSSQSINRYAS